MAVPQRFDTQPFPAQIPLVTRRLIVGIASCAMSGGPSLVLPIVSDL